MTVLDAPIGRGTLGKWGNSVGIRIPSEVVLRPKRESGLSEQERLRALYLELAAQVTPDTEGHKEDWEPVGDENFE